MAVGKEKAARKKSTSRKIEGNHLRLTVDRNGSWEWIQLKKEDRPISAYFCPRERRGRRNDKPRLLSVSVHHEETPHASAALLLSGEKYTTIKPDLH